MPVHDFLNMSEQDLLTRADQCVERAGSALEPGPRGINDFTRLYLFLEAQSCLAEVLRRQAERTADRDRARNEEIAQRDFRLERVVVLLIGAELLLSVIGLWAGYQQGKLIDKQTTALVHMDGSTASTATAMTAASTSLKTLAEDQEKSIDRLNQMNEILRDSLSRSSTMATATRKQLRILEQEQASRLAEQSKKPKLELSIGTVPLKAEPFNVVHPPSYPMREMTETSMTVELNLKNLGDATAHHPLLRVIMDANDVSIFGQGTTRPERLDLGEAGASSAVYLINIDFIRPRVNVPLNLTFNFPKGHAPFTLTFNVDADEIDAGTLLGAIKVSPPNHLP
jgi:hypothetical protein